jgi:hypothetical protein
MLLLASNTSFPPIGVTLAAAGPRRNGRRSWISIAPQPASAKRSPRAGASVAPLAVAGNAAA